MIASVWTSPLSFSLCQAFWLVEYMLVLVGQLTSKVCPSARVHFSSNTTATAWISVSREFELGSVRNSFLLFGKKKEKEREDPPFFLVQSLNFYTRSSRSPEKMQLSLQVSIRPHILSLQVVFFGGEGRLVCLFD